MRPGVKRLLIAVLIVAVLAGGLALLYKRFVTDAIMDPGGMERPPEQYETVQDAE